MVEMAPSDSDGPNADRVCTQGGAAAARGDAPSWRAGIDAPTSAKRASRHDTWGLHPSKGEGDCDPDNTAQAIRRTTQGDTNLLYATGPWAVEGRTNDGLQVKSARKS